MAINRDRASSTHLPVRGLLAGLFPQGVATAELDEPGSEALLFPSEAACVAGAVESRRREFAAGRSCARRAMAALGFAEEPLLRNPNKTPGWPEGVVGSITHAGSSYAAAAVARRGRIRSVGLDAELAGRVQPRLWRAICTEKETDWLLTLAESDRDTMATLIFSAKEAFYKCQYAVTGQFLGFQDAEIEVIDAGFLARPTRSIEVLDDITPMQGRYRMARGLVITTSFIAHADGP